MTHATGGKVNVVYLAWGFQGEDFTVHATREGALDFLLSNEYLDDLDRADINGEIGGVGGDLDGYFVEAHEVQP